MATRHSRGRLRSNFSLGGEQAEADPLLPAAFYESGDYAAIESQLDAHCFVIGRTGGGKSAALQRLEEKWPQRVVRISPEDLALPYITDLHAVRYLASLDVNLDLLFIALSKHVLLVELLKHRYNIDSPAAKQNFLTNIRALVTRDAAKRAALDYLDEFEGRFWCEADERVREITDRFEKRIEAELKGQLPLPLAGPAISGGVQRATTRSSEMRSEQAERFQRIVNETQLARLNKMIAVLNDDIFDSDQYFTYVVIDDLDRDWVDDRIANDLIRCLFRSVLDLKRVHNVKVLVALRTNIFEELEFSHRSGGQEEKFRSLILQMRWTRRELDGMLSERARVAGSLLGVHGIDGVADLLPAGSKSKQDPLSYILERTLMRPRDAIAFLNESLTFAGNKTRLAWRDLYTAERPYSEKRLLALRDEWKISHPDIHKVFEAFRRAGTPISKTELSKRLEDVALLLADPEFKGVVWLSGLADPLWTRERTTGSGQTYINP